MKVLARIFLALFILFLLLAGGAALALYQFDLNDHRDRIAAFLTNKVGAPVQINGPIDVSLYPRLGVTARELSIASTGNVEKRPLLRANHVVFALDPLALLDRKLVFHKIILVEPEIAITLDENNIGNWEEMFPEFTAQDDDGNTKPGNVPSIAKNDSTTPPSVESATSEAGRLFTGWLEQSEIVLSGFSIQQGIVRVRDDTIQEQFRFEHIEMEAGAGTNFPYDLSCIFRSESLQMRIAAHLRGTGIIDLDKPGIRLVGSSIQAEGELPLLGEIVHATLTGTAFYDPVEEDVTVKNAVFTTDEYVIKGQITGRDIYRRHLLFSGHGHYVDKTRTLDPEDPDSLPPLEFTSDFALGIRSIKLTNLVAHSPRNRVAPLAGTVDVWRFKGPNIRAELATDSLDLDQVFGTPSATGDGKPPSWLVPPGMANADLDMTIDAKKVRTGDLAAGPLTAHMMAKNGHVVVDLETGGLRRTAEPGPRDTVVQRAIRNTVARASIRAEGNCTSWDALAATLRGDMRLDIERGNVDMRTDGPPIYLDSGRLNLSLRGFENNAEHPEGNPLANAPFHALLETGLTGEESWTASLGGIWNLDFGAPDDLKVPSLLSITDGPALILYEGDPARMYLDWLLEDGERVSVRARALTGLDTGSGVLRLGQIDVNTLGVSVLGSAEIRDLFHSPIVFGDAAITPFSPRALLRRIGREAPVTAAPKVLSSAQAHTLFQVDEKGARFDNFNLALDNASIAGTASLTRWDDPLAKFTLRTGEIDLDAYLPPVPEKNSEPDPSAVRDLGKEDPVWDLSWLREPGIRLEGALSAKKLTWHKLSHQDIATTIRMGPGVLDLFPITGSFYGAPVKATMRARASEVLHLQIDAAARGFELEPVMQNFFDDDHLGGTADLSLSVTTQGLNSYQLRRHLNGMASFTVNDGFYRFYGENKPPPSLGGKDSTDRAVARTTHVPKAKSPERQHLWSAEFSQAHGTFKAENGVLSNDDFLMESLLAQAQGEGSADLAERTVDYLLNVQMTGIPTFPVHVHGPFENTKTDIQASGMVVDTAQRIGGSIFDIIGGAITLPFRAIERVAEPLFGKSGSDDPPKPPPNATP